MTGSTKNHVDAASMPEMVTQVEPKTEARRPCKIAFIMPSGLIQGHDRVASFHHNDIQKLVNTTINIGDTFVYEATLQLLRFDQAVPIPRGAQTLDQMVEEINNCDFAILRGSNYIHGEMQWGVLGKAIEASRVPVVAFGIGVQAPRYQPVKISEETERVLRVIAERSHSIGCRGRFTAETLERYGIKNTTVIGCPSIFRRNDRNLQVVLPAADSIKKVAFTISRGLSGMYCDDPRAARVKQIQAIKELNSRYHVYLITQAEKSEKLFYYRCYERIEEAKKLMRDSGWDLANMPWLEDLYWRRIFFGTTPESYASMAKLCDFTVGYRLHGNIIALSEGKPALYHTYDSRTRELVEYFSIPSYDVLDENEFSFENSLRPDLFDAFNAQLPVAYDRMRDFLDANKVPHRMTYALN